MKALKSLIILAASFSLFAAASACIAAGFLEGAIKQTVPSPGSNPRDLDEAHRQFGEPIDPYREHGGNVIIRETDQGNRDLYRLNLCYSEPKPTWCR